jgi:hypothetical protein
MRVLIVEPGPQNAKEGFLKAMTRSPFELFLLLNSAPRIIQDPWHLSYIPRDHTLFADFRNPRKAGKAIKDQLRARGLELSGVTTYQEKAVPVTQAIADELALPPITTGDALALRNKSLMRRRFTDVGLPQPRSILCQTPQEGALAVEELGIPCVVKPSQMASSVGVRKISSGEEISKAIHLAFEEDNSEEDTRFAYDIPPTVVVEEYVPTYQEVSCEGFVHAGRPQIIAITKKTLGEEPLFEEIGHATPYDISYEIKLVLDDQLSRAARALKLHTTAFHAEFRLRTSAPPILIELGARLPGGLVPHLVRLSLGVDMLRGILELAIGNHFSVSPRVAGVAAVRFFSDEDSARKLDAASRRLRQLPFVDEATAYQHAEIGRRAHVIWTAQDFNQLEDYWKIIAEIHSLS